MGLAKPLQKEGFKLKSEAASVRSLDLNPLMLGHTINIVVCCTHCTLAMHGYLVWIVGHCILEMICSWALLA